MQKTKPQTHFIKLKFHLYEVNNMTASSKRCGNLATEKPVFFFKNDSFALFLLSLIYTTIFSANKNWPHVNI